MQITHLTKFNTHSYYQKRKNTLQQSRNRRELSQLYQEHPQQLTPWRWRWSRSAAAAKSLQSCPTLCDPRDQAAPSLGFSKQEHWSGLPFPSPTRESEKWKWGHSVLSDSATPRIVTYWALPSVGFSRQEYCSGLPFPSPEDLPDPGIKPRSPTL